MTRPTAVTVVGWISVALGVLVVVGGLTGLSAIGHFSAVGDTMNRDTPPGSSAAFDRLVGIFRSVIVLELVLGVAMVASGSAFLGCRTWGRSALEILWWLSLVGVGIFSLFWLYAFLFNGISMEFLPGLAMGVVTLAIFVAIPVVMIRTLRSAGVRLAMTTSGGHLSASEGTPLKSQAGRETSTRFRNREEYEAWKRSQNSQTDRD